ncbi:sodium:proton antiporter, partial [Mesorhizobium sp. M5C.F.Ca.IN.020.32.2.1]
MRFAAALTAGAVVAVATLFPGIALAAEAHKLPGQTMSLWWALPFAGLLLSIATGPLLFHHVWEHHYGKITFFWAALAVVPLAVAFGMPSATEAVLHALLTEYMSFIILLFALFTISGGILVAGNIHGTPLVNAGLLLIGAMLASVIGTTGASMILIRPILRANDNRAFNAHVVIFFIFLVSNIGGSLTPLGDPPLFVGFLRGVDFFWTTTNLYQETLFVGGLVLAVFLAMDVILHRREAGAPKIKDPTPDTKVRIRGLPNVPLLAGVIGAILLSATWKPGVAFSVHGVSLELQNLVRDAVILALAFLSLGVSPKSHRQANNFH